MLGNIAIKYISNGIFVSLIVSLLCALPLCSQEASNISIQYTNYNTEDGLPNQLTNCIFQDSRGFFWIATNYGFSRFDGKTFVNYSPDDLGVPFGTINSIYEDLNGNLWLSEMSHENSLPKKKILIFNPDTEKLKFHPTPESRTYYSIASTTDKSILLGTEQGELLIYDGFKQDVVYEFEDKRPILQIVAAEGYYWLSSDKKLSLIKQNGEFVHEWETSQKFVLLGNKGENVYVRDVFYSSENTLEDRILLFKANSKAFEIALVNNLNVSTEVDEEWKYFSSEEAFVIYDYPGGLSLIEEDGDDIYLIDSLGGDRKSFNVEDVYFCSSGTLWASSVSGAYKIQITSSKFESFLHKEEPNNFSMRSIIPFGDSLYCNTYNGNFIYDLKKKKIVKRLSENDTGLGLSSIKASDGCIYRGGTGTAIQRICEFGGGEEYFYHKSTKSSSAISAPRDYWSILEDSRGKIWIGTNQGLSTLNREKGILERFDQYNQFTQLANTLIFDIIETKSAYWIGTQDGLYKMEFDKGITARFHSGQLTPDSYHLPTDVVFDIYEDDEGYLWFTSYGSGLIQFNPQDYTYKQITVKEGLAHNVTSDILEDDFENLWITTNKGLVSINRKSGKIINFDKSDGLHIDEFNKKTSAKLEDGRFVFGGLNGCVVYDPKDFLQEENEEVRSNLRVVQLIIDNTIRKAIDTSSPIVLADTKVDITFDLHLLEFEGEETGTYEWKWKEDEGGFKELPSYQLHLAEVPPGESTIVFNAKSAKGVPALNQLEVSFSAPALFSLTQLLAGAGIILALYFLLFYKKEKKESKWKQRVPAKRRVIETDEAIAEVVETKIKSTPAPTQKTEVSSVILSPADKKWLDGLTNVVQQSENIGQFSVKDMAAEVNLSSRQLNRRIKQLTGITPNQFLRDIKLERAKGLLESGSVTTVAEVSFAVGFEKPDYFSRLFQEKYGRRPVSYFDKSKG